MNNSYAGQLIDEIERLKDQIEKMKCCGNCKEYSETYRMCCRDVNSEMCVDNNKWEMQE